MPSSSRNSSNTKSSKGDRLAHREFGNNSEALERAKVPELPASQQNLRVQASSKGRKGKTVTVISGFQTNPETLTTLVKQLKTQCGTGGTVKENEIEIQGDHREKLVQILTQIGYKVKISGG